MNFPIYAVTIHTNIGLGWTILAALALIALAAWSYRWTRPPLPVWGRTSLAILRALAFLAVLLLVTGFQVRWVNEEPVRPRVAMLLDASESMSFTDPSGNRADSLRTIIEHPVWNELRQDVELDPAAFAANVMPWRGRAVPELDGAVTNVEAALSDFAGRAEGPPDALVLISDGAFNRGGAYTAAARRLGAPVYPVAVGDSLPSKDLVVASLVAPELGYAGEPFPLDVTIRATGADGATAKLRVIGEDGQVLATEDVSIEGTWSEQTVTVELTPQRAGVNSWTVEVAPLDGEVDQANNTRRAVVRAAERRRTVLVFSPAPHPDAGAVARTLEEDPDTDALIVIGGGRLTSPVRGSWDEINPANLDAALIFLQGPWSDRAKETLGSLIDAKLPTAWFVGDERLPNDIFTLVAESIGNPQPWIQPREAILRPVAAHPIFTDDGLFFDEGVIPPVLRGPYNPNEGRTLAVIDTDDEDLPTIVVPSQNPRTVAWFAGGLAAWDRVRRAEDPGGLGFHDLFDRTLRWLTGGAEQERITVRAEQELYAGGEEVRLVASVADPGLSPVEDARVVANVTRADGESRTVEFQSLGGGRYMTTFLPWGEGRYSFDTTVETDEETIARSGEFVVDKFQLEAAERRMRPDRLRALAEATGGQVVWSSADLDTLLSLLPRSGELVEVRGSWRPFGLWLTLLLVVGLLAAEWITRTRTGMA
ncbi:hypothetical protein KQI52_11735 [bacterium]|nr:hypothetical protein [bacterium]